MLGFCHILLFLCDIAWEYVLVMIVRILIIRAKFLGCYWYDPRDLSILPEIIVVNVSLKIKRKSVTK